MQKELDHVLILKALSDIPFPVGKKLLIDYLQGNANNKTIEKHNLKNKPSFASMIYEKQELELLIDKLILNGLIKQSSMANNRFAKVLEITREGRNEIINPTLQDKQLSFDTKETIITDQEREAFKLFGQFLDKYNDEQKKAIISNKQHILCIAGAGSGKTTVLTKRIEFLIKYCSVHPSKILAITFTRKARQEMMRRLGETLGVRIETFNSFCEKILKLYNNLIYNRQVRVINYADKIRIINQALYRLNLTLRQAINTYFTYGQRRGKSERQLINIFMNDCFFIRDYLKFKNRPLKESEFTTTDEQHKRSANIVFNICKYIEEYMARNGLRDFADQLLDTIQLFKTRPELMPKFDHILVDEYQDVNSTQIEFIDLLNPKNIFCVGDPRQSIFGWRGSDVKYILNFEEKYDNAEIISLKKNYRSTKQVVNLINRSIKNMGLPDLESNFEKKSDLKLLKFKTASAEQDFIVRKIRTLEIPRSEIFVLARTNRQLTDLSQKLRRNNIRHVVKTDEVKRSVIAKEGEITLATVHAIKGLEAKVVFVIGCTSLNFPCRGSDHPVVDMVKVDEYDKEEEERRLFYVAMSRAKDHLFLSYTGKKPTNFITEDMLSLLSAKNTKTKKEKQKSQISLKPTLEIIEKPKRNNNNSLIKKLKDWRKQLSKDLRIPAYKILHNKALEQIALHAPQTEPDLLEVYGVGPAKVRKYGDQILEIVNG